jgi:hypothetical protein
VTYQRGWGKHRKLPMIVFVMRQRSCVKPDDHLKIINSKCLAFPSLA